jgi:hypothetical protein
MRWNERTRNSTTVLPEVLGNPSEDRMELETVMSKNGACELTVARMLIGLKVDKQCLEEVQLMVTRPLR